MSSKVETVLFLPFCLFPFPCLIVMVSLFSTFKVPYQNLTFNFKHTDIEKKLWEDIQDSKYDKQHVKSVRVWRWRQNAGKAGWREKGWHLKVTCRPISLISSVFLPTPQPDDETTQRKAGPGQQKLLIQVDLQRKNKHTPLSFSAHLLEAKRLLLPTGLAILVTSESGRILLRESQTFIIYLLSLGKSKFQILFVFHITLWTNNGERIP